MPKAPPVYDAEERAKVGRENASRARRNSVRNIGVIPPIFDIGRREGCRKSLLDFGLTYFGEDFWPMSEDHKRFLLRLELIIKQGGRTCYVLPRGFGKSVWSRIAVLWSIVYGYRSFVPLIAANGVHAENNYLGMKALLETPMFAADFPSISYPIIALEGIAHRCGGQTYTQSNGDLVSTNIEYTRNRIVLPSTEGSFDSLGDFHPNQARNSVIISQGLFSAVRGLSFTRWDGTTMRPEFALVDDPQDEESAESPTQIRKRLKVLKSALIGSGGHSKPIAVAMAATIIAEDDLVEQILSDPAWSGERIAFFSSEPDAKESIWLGQYRRIRQDYDRNNPEDEYRAKREATEFYRANRSAMDAGAVVSWPDCYSREEGEISAVQHGMNALIDIGEEYYNSEVQNKPRRVQDTGALTLDHLRNATDTTKRGLVPGWTNKLTAAVDIHDDILYWLVVAWDKDTFSGHIVTYGTFPEQKDFYFKQQNIKRGIPQAFPGFSKEAAIRGALDKVLKVLEEGHFECQDGSERRVDRCMVDSGYKQEIIFRAILESNSRVFHPSKGEFYGAKGSEFNTITRNRRKSAKSDIVTYGDSWRCCKIEKYQDLRRVFYDANAWKTFIRERLKAPTGADGALRIYQYDKGHDLFYDHMLSETSTEVEAKGRKVIEWDNKLRRDNHWWDCLVYAAVAASMEGCHIEGTQVVKSEKPGRKRRRIGYE